MATKHIREIIGMDDEMAEIYVKRQMELISAGLFVGRRAGVTALKKRVVLLVVIMSAITGLGSAT